MNNLSKEKKQQLILVGFITLIVAGVIWMGLISSLQTNLELTRKKTEEMRLKVENAQKLMKRAEAIEEEAAEVQAKLQTREETMASGDLYQWFLSKMIGATQSRALNNFIPSGAPNLTETRMMPKFPYRSASYTVKVNGHYHEFGKFIADIENDFPFARIQYVDITPAPQSDERLNFSFEFVTLYHTNRAVSVR